MSNILFEIVDKNRIRFVKGGNLSWQEAIRESTLPLVQEGCVTEDYADQIISSIEESGPYIVFDSNIAMPHSTQGGGALKNAVSLMICQEMVSFGEDEDGIKREANLFFTVSSENSEDHLANIAALAQIFMNHELMAALSAARSPEDIVKAAEKYPVEE